MQPQTESTRLWESSLPGIELFKAQLFHHRFSKHFHNVYTIGLNETGQGCCQHGGKNRVLMPGSFNLINPGDMHTGQVASPEGWTFRNLYISLSVIQQTLTQLEWAGARIPYFHLPVVQQPTLRPIFYRLFRALDNWGSQLAQQSLLLALVSQLFCHPTKSCLNLKVAKSESKAVAAVKAYLEVHYAQPVSLNDLAQLVNLSPYYLIRCFRQQVGCAPHQYQRHWQLLCVKQALRMPVPLSTVAVDHGFYDQSHLNRAFKQTFGVTPGQYQKVNSVQY